MENALDFFVLALIYLFVFFKRWRRKGKDVLLINTLMYIYLSFVLYFTLMPILAALPYVANHPYVPMNFTPFIDVIIGRGNYVREITLNVIMTIPFGFLFPLALEQNQRTPNNAASPATTAPSTSTKVSSTFLKTLLATFLLSLAIELIQPLLSFRRSSDVTDLITNVTGGVLGFLFYLAFRPLATKLLDRLKTDKDTKTGNNTTAHEN